MSFESWMIALCGLFLLGAATHALATGRVTASGVRLERGTDWGGYWLGTGFVIVVAALFCFTWFRSVIGDEPVRFRSELFFGPYFLYLAIEALRAGEIRWGNNHFPRRGHARVYWMVLLVYGVAFALFGTALIYL